MSTMHEDHRWGQAGHPFFPSTHLSFHTMLEHQKVFSLLKMITQSSLPVKTLILQVFPNVPTLCCPFCFPRCELSFLKIPLFILFLGVLGLCCCERGLFVAVCRLLTGMASFVVEHGLQAHELQQLWHPDSVVMAHRLSLIVPWLVGSSPTRDRTYVPCIGRQILNCQAPREAPH